MRNLILRVKVLLFKELLQALRDPRLRFIIIIPPLIQLVAFGYAANLDLKDIPTEVIETDLLIVGGGNAGCFAAIEAKKLNPANNEIAFRLKECREAMLKKAKTGGKETVLRRIVQYFRNAFEK